MKSKTTAIRRTTLKIKDVALIGEVEEAFWSEAAGGGEEESLGEPPAVSFLLGELQAVGDGGPHNSLLPMYEPLSNDWRA